MDPNRPKGEETGALGLVRDVVGDAPFEQARDLTGDGPFEKKPLADKLIYLGVIGLALAVAVAIRWLVGTVFPGELGDIIFAAIVLGILSGKLAERLHRRSLDASAVTATASYLLVGFVYTGTFGDAWIWPGSVLGAIASIALGVAVAARRKPQP